MPEQIKYIDSQLYTFIHALNQQAKDLLSVLNQKKPITYQEKTTIATISFINNLLDTIDKIARQFDDGAKASLINLSLMLNGKKLKSLTSYENLVTQHGTLAYHVFTEIKEKMIKHGTYSKQQIKNYLSERKNASMKKLSANIGTCIEMDSLYDKMAEDVLSVWPDDSLKDKDRSDQVTHRLNILFKQYFLLTNSPFIQYEFRVYHPESIDFISNMLFMFNNLPDKLKELIPFYNPDAIVFDGCNKILSFITDSKNLSLKRVVEKENDYLYQVASTENTFTFDLNHQYQEIRQKVFFYGMQSLQTKEILSNPTSDKYGTSAIQTTTPSHFDADEITFLSSNRDGITFFSPSATPVPLNSPTITLDQ